MSYIKAPLLPLFICIGLLACSQPKKGSSLNSTLAPIHLSTILNDAGLSDDDFKFKSESLDKLFGEQGYSYIVGDYSGTSFENFSCLIIGLFDTNHEFHNSYTLFFDNNEVLQDTLNITDKDISLSVSLEKGKRGIALGKVHFNNPEDVYFQIIKLYELDIEKVKLKSIDIKTKIIKCEIPIEYLTEEYIGVEDFFHFGTNQP